MNHGLIFQAPLQLDCNGFVTILKNSFLLVVLFHLLAGLLQIVLVDEVVPVKESGLLSINPVVIQKILGKLLKPNLLHFQTWEPILCHLAFPKFQEPSCIALLLGVSAFVIGLPRPVILKLNVA